MTDISTAGTSTAGISTAGIAIASSAVAGTIPYPWPYDAADGLAPARLALVVAGAQARWATDAAEVVDRIDALATTLRAVGVLVAFVRHARPSRPRRRRDDLPAVHTRAWELVCARDPRDLIVDTQACDGFFSEQLDLELRAHGRDHLLLAGLASEVLVDSTLRSANDRGYECLTLRDAVHPLFPDTGERVLSSVTMSGGIFGAVGSSDAVLAALACRARPAERDLPTVPDETPTRPRSS